MIKKIIDNLFFYQAISNLDIAKFKLKLQILLNPELKLLLQLKTKIFFLGLTQALDELKQFTSTSKPIQSEARLAIASWYLSSGQAKNYPLAADIFAGTDANHIKKSLKLSYAIAMQQYCLLSHDETFKNNMDALLNDCSASVDKYLCLTSLAQTAEKKTHYLQRALQIPVDGSCILQHDNSVLPPKLSFKYPPPAQPRNNNEKISVVIQVKQNLPSLDHCLLSILNQTHTRLDVLIVVAEDFAERCNEIEQSLLELQNLSRDIKFRLISHHQVPNANAKQSDLLQYLDSEYVVFVDEHEWFHPRRLEIQMHWLAQHRTHLGCSIKLASCDKQLNFVCADAEHLALSLNEPSTTLYRTQMLRSNLPAKVAAIDRFLALRIYASVNAVEILQQCIMRKNKLDIFYEALIQNKYSALDLLNLLHQSNGRFYDVIIASDLRMHGGSTQSNIEEIKCQIRSAISTAILPMFRYDYPIDIFNRFKIHPALWRVIDLDKVTLLHYADQVSADLVIMRYPPILQSHHNLLPKMQAKHIRVIMNQLPFSHYGNDSVLRYRFASCQQSIQQYFNTTAVWHPIGPLVRAALQEHHADELNSIHLSNIDWVNIIDLNNWTDQHQHKMANTTLTIGRHSRDDVLKWPDTTQEIYQVYPNTGDVQVKILGGVNSIQPKIGKLPCNWHVYQFGEISPAEFLNQIDVFVYFTSASLVESFGRVIIEAMASGTPVILPIQYQCVFADAAIYAKPEHALTRAKALFQDKHQYAAQAVTARNFVMQNFSYQAHQDRLRQLGVKGKH